MVSSGQIRLGLFLPQFEKDTATDDVRANPVYLEITRALADRLGVAVQLVARQTPAEVVECLDQGDCDVAFMASNEPSRTSQVGFAPPVVQLDYTYLVPRGSPIQSVPDASNDRTRVAVVRNHASTLALDRVATHAQRVTAEIPEEAFQLLRTGRVDAWASVRSTLIPFSRRLPGSRVLADRYGANLIAMAVPKARADRLSYVTEFIERAKASGVVKRAGLSMVPTSTSRRRERSSGRFST